MQPDYDASTESLRMRLGNGIGTKWTRYGPDVIPLWIADMDFGVPPEVRSQLISVIDDFGLGYSSQQLWDSTIKTFSTRYEKLYGCYLSPEHTLLATDVVQAIYLAITTLSNPGDKVIVQSPVYPPFMSAITDTGRMISHNQLLLTDNGYIIDFDDLNQKMADPSAKILLLCNPHNPTGRVFTYTELDEIAELAAKNGVIVIADEIHADITYESYDHIPFAIAARNHGCDFALTTSASKAFNLAGIRCAVVSFSTDDLRKEYETIPFHMRGAISNMGMVGTIAAWTASEEWRIEIMNELQANRRLIKETLARCGDKIKYLEPEGTFLAWLDLSSLSGSVDPSTVLLEKAKIALSPGPDFGPGGAGFARLNFATSRQNLTNALSALLAAFDFED